MSTLLRTSRTLILAAVVVVAMSPCLAVAAETQQHDVIGRLTDVAYANGGSVHYTYDANGNILSIVTSLAISGVEGGAPTLRFALGPTTPNPGSGARGIAFAIPTRGHVTLRAFDVSGRAVATLYDRVLDPGRYNARFSTDRWANGIYYYRLELGSRALTGRLVVLR